MEPTKATLGKLLPNPKLKLLDQVREVCRRRQFSLRTEGAYVGWVKRFLVQVKSWRGEGKQPRELGAAEVRAFRSHRAGARHVAASTQNQACNAIYGSNLLTFAPRLSSFRSFGD